MCFTDMMYETMTNEQIEALEREENEKRKQDPTVILDHRATLALIKEFERMVRGFKPDLEPDVLKWCKHCRYIDADGNWGKTGLYTGHEYFKSGTTLEL